IYAHPKLKDVKGSYKRSFSIQGTGTQVQKVKNFITLEIETNQTKTKGQFFEANINPRSNYDIIIGRHLMFQLGLGIQEFEVIHKSYPVVNELTDDDMYYLNNLELINKVEPIDPKYLKHIKDDNIKQQLLRLFQQHND